MTAENGNVDGMSFFAQFSEEVAAFGAKFTPSTDENAELDFKLYKNDSKICDGLINITAGSIDIDILNGKTSVEKDTCVTFAQGDNTFQFKFDDAATLTYAADEGGISQFTFGNNDGKLDLTLYRDGKEILTANMEINGTIKVDTENESIGVTKDTTATIKINDHIYTLTATDDAGGTVTFQDDKFIFTPDTDDGGLQLIIAKGTTPIFGGTLNITGGSVTLDPTTQKFSFTEGTNIAFAIGDGSREIDLEIKDSDASFTVEPDSEGNFTITPDTDDGKLDLTLKHGDQTIVTNTLSIDGSIVLNPATQSVSLTQGTTINLSLLNYDITATANDDAGVSIQMTNDGLAITPADGDSTLNVSIARDDVTIFQNTVEISGGSIVFSPTTQSLTITDGTTINLQFGNYTLTATADGKAVSSIALTDGGIAITPNTGDGTLNLTLTGTSSGSLSANIEVLSGTFTLGEGGALTVAKDTELQIKFSDDYTLSISRRPTTRAAPFPSTQAELLSCPIPTTAAWNFPLLATAILARLIWMSPAR